MTKYELLKPLNSEESAKMSEILSDAVVMIERFTPGGGVSLSYLFNSLRRRGWKGLNIEVQKLLERGLHTLPIIDGKQIARGKRNSLYISN